MQEVNASTIRLPGSRDSLQEILRQGAQTMLTQAIEAEVAEWIEQHRHVTDQRGRRQVVRNGYLPERKLVTGVGEIAVEQPRVHDRRPAGEREHFSSKLLPPYLRKTKSIEELIPYLYLKGISTGGFQDALSALLGPDCPGLSATTIVRLKAVWEQEYHGWSTRSLEGREYVYVWADGIHTNIRLEDDRQCILVLMGATKDGKKELIAMTDGHRESAQSWRELLLDVKRRGMTIDPKLAVGDGALGFWKALAEIFPTTKEQRCWVHKTANVLDKLPKNKQPQAKSMIHEIWMADTRENANQAFDAFLETYQAKYANACECLAKDRDVLLTFYDFPAEHWRHLRTTNPIESTFATIRLRHRRTKGNGSRIASLTMMFKLAESAARRWRMLNGHELLPDVIQGVVFQDGLRLDQAAA
ncbi:MAG TPA: IS256 family transposase [Terrimicrobiaceae bacterium]|nr:IS256 family transposase [Terrimicrobiaceae bacterium]